ncbi:DUF4365 domain-containing protein [Paenarthrobacter aromaticivorans]|uniref:DUF4365 domain-containing protein n=1 Tax=Paenarthrobacter aromaticivorans TaxID=2849150 RepID=A0ABS6IAE5_9MICC|nr:DUF4365 domain-containing protein [Paenarthrobacter sp. MMS21-TAE1-1]MBU8867816.1 DUF4365 domain-containing protein [Paenarthrobacter sp. MMS21-TAE1-1]
MTKFQDENQLKGRFGELLAAFAFPPEWVVRPIQYDYGLDLEVEVFHAIPSSDRRQKYQTWGEHSYLQVKTTDNVSFGKYKGSDKETEVLKFLIETTELRLVEAMGASVPVILFVVDRANLQVFYICLNDYISKILTPCNPAWRDQRMVTLYIPVRNQIKVSDKEFDPTSHWGYFARTARRSKIYSAANLTHHYSIELGYALVDLDAGESNPEIFSKAALQFLERANQYAWEIAELDIWRKTDSEWGAMEGFRETLTILHDRILQLKEPLKNLPSRGDEFEQAAFHFLGRVDFMRGVFTSLSTIGRLYEQIGRLERLPGDDPFEM